MFKKLIYKSVAGATAVGSLLAVSLVATPATITSAPAIRNVSDHCANQYAHTVSTTTDLQLARTAAQYGTRNVASVQVSRDDAGASQPVGRVRVSILGLQSWTVRLVDGMATVALPRTLTARRTYIVVARYLPRDCSVFAASRSNRSYYTVIRAGVRLNVDAPNVDSSVRPRVDVQARSLTGVTVPGSVRVRLYRDAVLVDVKWAMLDDGFVRVFFPRKRPGVYDARVYYPARTNFSVASGEDDFRVFR